MSASIVWLIAVCMSMYLSIMCTHEFMYVRVKSTGSNCKNGVIAFTFRIHNGSQHTHEHKHKDLAANTSLHSHRVENTMLKGFQVWCIFVKTIVIVVTTLMDSCCYLVNSLDLAIHSGRSIQFFPRRYHAHRGESMQLCGFKNMHEVVTSNSIGHANLYAITVCLM